MANAWKLKKATPFLTPRTLLLLFPISLLLIFFLFFSKSSTPSPNFTNFQSLTPSPQYPIPPFNCFKCPQSHPIIANLVECLHYPFLYSQADLGSLPDKPHKNIVRLLKGKLFRKPDISVTIQDVLEKMKSVKDGYVVDVGVNVVMASFAAAVMGFKVLAFEPVFENLQRICDGIWFNRVGDRVTLFEAAASDRLGNITFHKKETISSSTSKTLVQNRSQTTSTPQILSLRHNRSPHLVICSLRLLYGILMVFVYVQVLTKSGQMMPKRPRIRPSNEAYE
ncbi:hypothetical protein ACHQM5_013979 [Ranunculus cassubicifolius]